MLNYQRVYSHIFAINPMIYWWIHHDPVTNQPTWSPAGESRAFENGHRNSEFSHEKWWIFPEFFVCLPEGIESIL